MAQQPHYPRKSVADASYAVHREANEAGPSSPRHEDSSRPNTPPPYSGPTSPSMNAPAPTATQLYHPGLPRLDYALYHPANFELSSDRTTITSYDPVLSMYPAKLVSLVKALATVPPKPMVRIIGKNNEGGVHFDLRINCMNLVVPEDAKHRMNYVKTLQPGENGWRGDYKQTTVPTVTGGLEEWAKRFCDDTSAIKHFVLEREVTNWDTAYLDGRIRSLISSTSYTGHVVITFPQTHSKVLVRNPDKVNKFFSSVTKVFTGTKKYEVVKSIWPYADVPRGETGRRVVVQEEEDWFLNWRDSIRFAVLSRRNGWVTIEDKLAFLMEPSIAGAKWGATATS